MTVADVFFIRSRGTVVTGKVDDGVVRVGDEVRVGDGPPLRVDGIEAFRKTLGAVRTTARKGMGPGGDFSPHVVALPTCGETSPLRGPKSPHGRESGACGAFPPGGSGSPPFVAVVRYEAEQRHRAAEPATGVGGSPPAATGSTTDYSPMSSSQTSGWAAMNDCSSS
jgi:hypothetical protein